MSAGIMEFLTRFKRPGRKNPGISVIDYYRRPVVEAEITVVMNDAARSAAEAVFQYLKNLASPTGFEPVLPP